MMIRHIRVLCCMTVLLAATAQAQERSVSEAWDYVAPMRKVAAKFRGRAGVVLHVGDSITYSNPYGQWARAGQGRTPADLAVLKWMHLAANDETDGWWLCRFDHPSGGRSHTACSGIRSDEMLRGGKRGMPALAAMLEKYRPQIVVLMLGTNDASARRPLAAYQADMRKCVDLILGRGAVCILSTIPPHHGRLALAKSYNVALRKLAKSRGLPLIDFEREILKRRPDDWNGTLLGKNDVHPTASVGGVRTTSPPTAGNLRSSGYLLRGWLSVKKIAAVKRTVIDGKPPLIKRQPEQPSASAQRITVERPRGEMVRLPITRDTRFSSVGDEANHSRGGSNQLKLKSNQEMALIDFDATKLKGRVINGATLHVHVTGKERLHRITASSFALDWIEGTSYRSASQVGSSSFNSRQHPDVPWAGPGSDLCAVTLGSVGTVWSTADSIAPDAKGWQRIAIDPKVVAARVAGISHGILLFDDTGSEWTRQGEQFTLRIFPNRYVHSGESRGGTAPYLNVYLGETDRLAPSAPTGLKFDAADLPAGEAWVSWNAPADRGPAGTVGFLVTIGGKPVPQYLVPVAPKSAESVRMHVRDLGLSAGANVKFSVRAVDGAGNTGTVATLAMKVSDRIPAALPGTEPKTKTTVAALPKLRSASVAIIDALDKVHPVSRALIPGHPNGYLASNHLWQAGDRQVRLHAARNEFVAFQIVVQGTANGLQPKLTFARPGSLTSSFGEYRYVNSKRGPLPDPIVTLTKPFNVPSRDAKIARQTSGSLLCEVYVPHSATAGIHRATLSLQSDAGSLEIPVSIEVWDFTLPDHLSFIPEMNCYSLPAGERDYYRLAHKHRTVLNHVPYSQRGIVEDGCAPIWDGEQLDWRAWDRRFGQYFDGSAFADLPRRGVPIECFYLPIHENWPSRMQGNYNGDYWADRAFPARYRRTLVEVSRQMAAHFNSRGWHQTLFHFFLNGKNNYKRNGWSRGSSPWLLDEPAHFQDYWALRWFGGAFHEGVNQAGGKAKMLYRCDISRPQWQRDLLDDVLDYNVVSGAMRKYHRMVMDRKQAFGQMVVEYGGTNAIESSNMQPVGWCIDSWTLGSDGVLPWQTVGRTTSWQQADSLSLFYPGQPAGRREPVPSIRLKAYRRGQQIVEYLTLLAGLQKEPRWAIGQQIRKSLRLVGQRQGTGFVGGEDAGMIHYAQLLPEDVWALRVRIGRVLSQARPAAKRKLVDFRPPRRRPANPILGYVTVGEVPQFETAAAQPTAAGPTVTRVLQGRSAVRDVILDPSNSAKPLGSVPKDNRLRRTQVGHPLLIRFELARAGALSPRKLKKAMVSFYVWDPSSKGRTKVGAFPLKQPWDEATATWQQAATGRSWQRAKTFTFGVHTGAVASHVIVEPDMSNDIVNPPIEYRLDVTSIVKNWLAGQPNYGLAVAPIVDRSIDNGLNTRFQVYASEYRNPKYTPKLTLSSEP